MDGRREKRKGSEWERGREMGKREGRGRNNVRNKTTKIILILKLLSLT